MNKQYLPKTRWAVLAASMFIAACGAVAHTEALWRSAVSSDETGVTQAQAADADALGNLYQSFGVGSQYYLRKLSATGEETWRVRLSHPARYLDASAQGVVVGSLDGLVSMLNDEGTVQWTQTQGGSLQGVAHAASGQVYVRYRDASNNGHVVALAADGSELWQQSYALPAGQNLVFPAVELSNGNVAMLVPAAGNLDVIVLDAGGVEITRTVLGTLRSNSLPELYAAAEQMLVVWEETTQNLITSLGHDGVVQWSYAGAHPLDCSSPTENRMACVNDIPEFGDRLIFVDLAGDLLSSRPLGFDPVPLNGAQRILSSGNGKWVVKDYVGPTRAANFADSLIPKTFYFKHYVYDRIGLSTGAVVMASGQVTFSPNEFNEFVNRRVTKPADVPDYTMVTADRLLVSGWKGNFDEGIDFAAAYTLP